MTVSRRTFLSRGSVGLTLGALAMVPGAAAILKLPAPPVTAGAQAGLTEPLVAHVRDVTSGEIVLMAGTTQVVVRDVDLAGRMYAAARHKR